MNYIYLFFLIVLSGFFSGAEVALLSVSRVRVRIFAKEKRRGSQALQRLKDNPRRMIITVLIGNNVANITAASLAAIVAVQAYGSTGVGIAAGVITIIILIFGEITPKSLANNYAGTFALWISRPIEILQHFLLPLVVFLDWLTGRLDSIVKIKKSEEITEDDIKTMVEFGVEAKVVAPEEQFIINRALAFSDTTVRSVMIPLSGVFSIDDNAHINESTPKIIKSGFTRVPIYEDEKDNIIGIVMVKDIARELVSDWGQERLRDIMVQPIFISAGMRIDYLFRIFQKQHKHMAVIVDINKKALGIVTLEDLIEELMGDIVDESDVSTED